ncbi:MAG: hypothetical protein NC548_55325 [Lachnospiraceae bacterium]|nr:hypothetical protein [Lachnospiraceae bacterium]
MTFRAQIAGNVLNAVKQTYSIVGASDVADTKSWWDRQVDAFWGNNLVLEFDTIEECTTAGRATTTQYPTEHGFSVTDYKYKNPDVITMRGILSEGGILGLTSVLPRKDTWDRKSAIEQVRNKLDELCANMTLVDIQTRNAGLRKNLTLTSFEINEDYDTYGLFSVEMTFQEVLLFKSDGTFVARASDASTQQGGVVLTQKLK